MHKPSFLSPRILRWAALALSIALLQACSAVRLAYNQVPTLAYWQINSYLGLSETQAEKVRSELGDLHQWHRDTMLPRHAELLQKVRQQLPSEITAEQACSTYAEVRVQLDRVIDQKKMAEHFQMHRII